MGFAMLERKVCAANPAKLPCSLQQTCHLMGLSVPLWWLGLSVLLCMGCWACDSLPYRLCSHWHTHALLCTTNINAIH